MQLTNQQRHEELVQVDDLDAAQTHRDLSVHHRHVFVALPLCRPQKQRQFEVEHLITHDGDHLQQKHISSYLIQKRYPEFYTTHIMKN